MRQSRIYQNTELAQNEQVELDQRASHYVANVLRLRLGDTLTLFNGRGDACESTIADLNKRQVTVRLTQPILEKTESPLKIYLYQGLCRGEKMDFVIQKSVELGVNSITPIITERTEVKLKPEKVEKRLEHWSNIIISACEQCGRNMLPELAAPKKINELTFSSDVLVLDPVAQIGVQSLEALKEISIVIGPEGGLSDSETESLKAAGATGVSLGPRILRTETAALATISVLQTCFGDFS